MKFKISLPVILLLVLAVLIILVISNRIKEPHLAPAPSGGDFELQTNNGIFNLKEQRGKIVLIYFGYTYCPDICPTNLSHMAQALNELTEAELARVEPVFISVDPHRDSLEHLENYTRHFHHSIVGMTGDEEAVAKIAKQYGAAYQKVIGESEGGYLMDHSSFTYLVDQDGQLTTSFLHATHPQEMVDTIRTYLNK